MDKEDGTAQNYWYVIPSRLAESGSATTALLFGLISSLTNRDGYCFASNRFLGKKLGGKSIATVKRHMNKLEKDGWITIEIDRTLENQERRKIKLGGVGSKTSWGGSAQKRADPNIGRVLNINNLPNGKLEQSSGKVRDKVGDKLISKPNKTYGDPRINEFIAYFENQLGTSLDESVSNNRNFTQHLLRKLQKDYPKHTPLDLAKSLVRFATHDPYRKQYATSAAYIYRKCNSLIQSMRMTKAQIQENQKRDKDAIKRRKTREKREKEYAEKYGDGIKPIQY